MAALKGLFLLAVGFAVVSSAPLDDEFDIDIGKTIESVQSILEAHPELPRLSNDDILMLLKNITEEDRKKIGVPKKEEKIMVVLPFKASDDKDMSELFTKRPITKFVSSHSYNDVERTTSSSVVKESDKMTKKSNKSNSKKTTTQKTPDKQEANEIPFKYDDPVDDDQLLVGSSQIPLGDISAYETFKPLPLAYKQEFDVPIDVKNLLKTYDLLENSSKKKQEIQITASSENNPVTAKNDTFEYIDPSLLPAEMSDILTEMGLMKSGPANGYLPINPDDLENPQNTELGEGVDPLALEEIEESIDNEIKKRQESNSTTTESSDDATTKVTESPKEASSEGPSIEDLESSFGGSNADDDPSQAELPPPRRNGFYYMVDWNSFLEVGDGDTKVNIRFNPKLGDPHRFIPVTVP